MSARAARPANSMTESEVVGTLGLGDTKAVRRLVAEGVLPEPVIHRNASGVVLYRWYDRAAIEAARDEVEPSHGRLPPAECGTRSGYARHLRRGEQACRDCKDAVRDYQRSKRARTTT